jgi:hypothetical protein
VVVLATFIVTTVQTDPASAVAMLLLLALGLVLDFGWKRMREARLRPTKVEFQ